MLSFFSAAPSFAPAPLQARASSAPLASAPTMGFGKTELMALAKEQNPVLGYFDPMGLADKNFWDQGEEASIAWLRHAEIKHGRIAMAGFVGFIVHSAGITFPLPW